MTDRQEPQDLHQPEVLEVPSCSSKGCAAPAVWGLEWNNPKLHTPERRKVWLACEEHRESLSDFLGSRSFLKAVLPWREARPV